MNQELFTRGIEEVIVLKNLEQRLKSKKKLRIKYGVDPSSSDIHLGHTVVLNKLKELQRLGHTIIFLIGDYTALIGDPSGRDKTRPVLTEKKVKNNAQTYLLQVGKILDARKAEIRRNSEWYNKMTLKELIDLASNFSVASIIERDDFEKRLKEKREISMHELLYPMMQAYDSVILEADVEFGGSDQRFNMLAGRELQKKMGQAPQEVVTSKLLVGTDGKEKMSKSLGNYIGISENPDSMFGKIMSIPDKLILEYFELCTDASIDQLKKYSQSLKRGENPRDIKEKLAEKIVAMYYGKTVAEKAKSNFIAQFQKKEVPKNIPKVKLSGNYELSLFLINLPAAKSSSEAKRLIEQGGVKIDGTKITDPKAQIATYKGMIVQVGKRRFWKIA